VRQPFAACARHGDDPRAAAHCLDGGVVAPIMRAVLLPIIRLDTCTDGVKSCFLPQPVG
jgi:hypothetical protein